MQQPTALARVWAAWDAWAEDRWRHDEGAAALRRRVSRTSDPGSNPTSSGSGSESESECERDRERAREAIDAKGSGVEGGRLGIGDSFDVVFFSFIFAVFASFV